MYKTALVCVFMFLNGILTGKLFRSSDLWKLIEFFLIFYQDKPGDWLLSQFFSVKYCKLDYSHVRSHSSIQKILHLYPLLYPLIDFCDLFDNGWCV